MKGRPKLYTDYQKETAILNTNTQKIWAAIVLISLIVGSFYFSQSKVPIANATVIFMVSPFFITIISIMVFGSSVPRK